MKPISSVSGEFFLWSLLLPLFSVGTMWKYLMYFFHAACCHRDQQRCFQESAIVPSTSCTPVPQILDVVQGRSNFWPSRLLLSPFNESAQFSGKDNNQFLQDIVVAKTFVSVCLELRIITRSRCRCLWFGLGAANSWEGCCWSHCCDWFLQDGDEGMANVGCLCVCLWLWSVRSSVVDECKKWMFMSRCLWCRLNPAWTLTLLLLLLVSLQSFWLSLTV